MALSPERLREIVSELASRPQHEKVRSLVYELLVNGLGARSTEVDFERPVPEVRGRIDALLGRTVFEFKSDLRREKRTVSRAAFILCLHSGHFSCSTRSKAVLLMTTNSRNSESTDSY